MHGALRKERDQVQVVKPSVTRDQTRPSQGETYSTRVLRGSSKGGKEEGRKGKEARGGLIKAMAPHPHSGKAQCRVVSSRLN